jgi:hypothetical protein
MIPRISPIETAMADSHMMPVILLATSVTLFQMFLGVLWCVLWPFELATALMAV